MRWEKIQVLKLITNSVLLFFFVAANFMHNVYQQIKRMHESSIASVGILYFCNCYIRKKTTMYWLLSIAHNDILVSLLQKFRLYINPPLHLNLWLCQIMNTTQIYIKHDLNEWVIKTFIWNLSEIIQKNDTITYFYGISCVVFGCLAVVLNWNEIYERRINNHKMFY